MSRPSRARGLKQGHAGRGQRRHPVAPVTGAWIETRARLGSGSRRRSRPSRARGLKLRVGSGLVPVVGRARHGRVD